ncbi:hypothetical protein RB195_002417 [Necator americanus]|uniref:Reverse transcriptase domain-containing protein n=1 Tax=Necator americanus TaxID=51031 RepID=A0ABR1DJQ5_NECAM
MLKKFNETGRRIGLRIKRKKTQFMKNVYCDDGRVQRESFEIVETPMHVYLGRAGNYGPTDRTRSPCPEQDLFDSALPPALCNAVETADLRAVSRFSEPAKYMSKAEQRWSGHIMRRVVDRWTKRKLEWIPKDAKRPRGKPPTRWGDVWCTNGPTKSSPGYG